MKKKYIYDAVVVSVYDGDTVTLDIDLGLGSWLHKQKFRIHGIDAPEIRGEEREEGLIARDWVRSWLPKGEKIVVRTRKDKKGKYGRWVAEIFVYDIPGDKWVSLASMMVAEGLAETKEY